MSKKYFDEKEISILSKNQFVLKVSKASITYSDKFKKIFIEQYLDGKLPCVIFQKYGFDSEILGVDRINSSRFFK